MLYTFYAYYILLSGHHLHTYVHAYNVYWLKSTHSRECIVLHALYTFSISRFVAIYARSAYMYVRILYLDDTYHPSRIPHVRMHICKYYISKQH